jgi:hypothetical protein
VYQRVSELLQIDGEGSLDGTTTGNNSLGLESPLDDADGIVQRPDEERI